jgi:hypothetical protein
MLYRGCHKRLGFGLPIRLCIFVVPQPFQLKLLRQQNESGQIRSTAAAVDFGR